MKVKFTGRNAINETLYFNRRIEPGDEYEIKDKAGKELVKSKDWKEVRKGGKN